MKRTRRVEVIRYSRRSTVISNELALEAELTTEQAAIDVLLGIPDTFESPVEETSGGEQQLSGAVIPVVVERHRLLRFLKKLVRG